MSEIILLQQFMDNYKIVVSRTQCPTVGKFQSFLISLCMGVALKDQIINCLKWQINSWVIIAGPLSGFMGNYNVTVKPVFSLVSSVWSTY